MSDRGTDGDRGASDGVIPTMRQVVAHLRMRVNQSHANFRDNLDWIYADKLEREAENLERYCQQLASDLTDALAELPDEQALPDPTGVRAIKRVRDVLAGKPFSIPTDATPAKTRRALAREYFGYGCEYEASGDIASGGDLAEPGGYDAAVERGFAKLWTEGE